MSVTYILPVRVSRPVDEELMTYLRWLSTVAEVIVVDASPPDVFADHAIRLSRCAAHVEPDLDVRRFVNGKVAGVLTGLRRASHERVVIADDDVRYDGASLAAITEKLDVADVVRPQNYFDPLPWHACVDTARSLLNRVSGGDWPGTLGVRRSIMDKTGGYAGDVMFENLELVRTVRAAGGRETVVLGLYVRRLPPSAEHFWSQRVRQAYDEFARPARLALWLTMLPVALGLMVQARWRWIAAAALVSIAAAEVGRQRAGGRRVFPVAASLAAPLWIAERAVSAWLAVGAHLLLGGIPYRGRIIVRAATPLRSLRQRFRNAHTRNCGSREMTNF